MVSIFTKDGVTIHNEKDDLITCQGEPLLVGVRDEHSRYRIPLIQHKRQWQPCPPWKRVNTALLKANSVYDLPSVKQVIHWMHAICSFPVKSTWLKAIKAGNFVGWPLLTECKVFKYYPDTDKTTKGHLNQTRKNVCSTKRKTAPFEQANVASLHGKKIRDIYATVYDERKLSTVTKPANFPHVPSAETNTSWSWLTSTVMLFYLNL
jgi:hypothetical protein